MPADPMADLENSSDGPTDLIARCGYHASVLREIGEESMASDVEKLVAEYVHELAGGRRRG